MLLYAKDLSLPVGNEFGTLTVNSGSGLPKGNPKFRFVACVASPRAGNASNSLPIARYGTQSIHIPRRSGVWSGAPKTLPQLGGS
jgi:hypothetical protein